MITDYDIEALIDNELKWSDRVRIYRHVMSDINAYRKYKKLRKQKKMIQKWYNQNQKGLN